MLIHGMWQGLAAIRLALRMTMSERHGGMLMGATDQRYVKVAEKALALHERRDPLYA